jgi:hypothetical protein
MKLLFSIFSLIFSLFSFDTMAQQSVVNKKGTITSIDSSKWTASGADIFSKNTGNVGLGNPSPTYKLDITGKLRLTDSLVTNTGRVVTLNSGTINDSLVVADPTTGVLKRISRTRLNIVDTANNGLSKVADTVQLGGTLTKATTITQGSNKLVFTSSIVDGFAVDGTTFSIDGSNNRIGIGTNAPAKSLEVNSGVANTSGVRFSNLTSTSPTSTGTTIGVNTTGDIITMNVPATSVYTNASVATSSSTTRADVAGLSFAVTSGKNYRVKIIGTYQTVLTTTGGAIGLILSGGGAGTIAGFLEADVAVPTATTSTGVATGLRSGLRAISTTVVVGSFLITTGVNPINTSHYIGGEFVFKCTSSGTLQVQWGSEVSTSTAQLDAGCNMFVNEY